MIGTEKVYFVTFMAQNANQLNLTNLSVTSLLTAVNAQGQPVNIATGAVVATSTSSSSCQVCPITPPRTTQRVLTPATCQALLQLRNSTNNQLGINALCNKISSETTLKEVTDQLNTYQTSLTANVIANDFLNDIKPTTLPTRHISKHINSNFGIEQLKAWKKLYTSGFETDFEYIRTLSYKGYLNNTLKVDMTNCTIISISTNYVKIRSNGYDNEITITGGKHTIRAVAGSSTTDASCNDLLNVHPLLQIEDAEYIIDGRYTYTTDVQGRVKKISGELAAISSSRVRNADQQTYLCNILKQGTQGSDDGGHMIAKQFFGASEQINYFPQDLAMNRSPSSPNTTNPNPRPGLWYAMETEWKNARLAGSTVIVEITPVFPVNSKRPTGFNVIETIGTNAPNPRPYIPNL